MQDTDQKRIKLLYVARFIPFYRGGILTRLEAQYSCRFRCQDKEFGVGKTPDLPQLNKIKMKSIFGKFDWLPTKKNLKDFQPDIVISELGLSFLTVFWLVFAKRIYGFKLAFWTHGLEGPRKEKKMWLSDWVRKFILEQSDAVIYYTEGCEKSSKPYLKGSRGYIATNTLDSSKLEEAWEEVGLERCRFRNAVVFIGRLVESKRVRELLDLARLLQDRKSSVRIQIAGGGPLESELIAEAEMCKLPVDFLGAVTKDRQKAELLGTALAGVCLGRVGLNIVDNVCFGLPLITLRKQDLASAHAPEVDYLIDGETGWMCEDLKEVADCILELENDEVLRKSYQKSCRQYFLRQCSIERQFKGFEEFVSDVFSCSRVESTKS